MAKRVAIVTGGTSGMGHRIVKELVEQGFTVVASGRDLEAAKTLPRQASFIRADLTRKPELKSLVDRTVKKHGRIDLIVNVAGLTLSKAGGIKGLASAMDKINFKAPKSLIEYAQPHLESSGGRVINISTMGTHFDRAGTKLNVSPGFKKALGHYTRSKLKLEEWSARKAPELKGVLIHTLRPGQLVGGTLDLNPEVLEVLSKLYNKKEVRRDVLPFAPTSKDIAKEVGKLATGKFRRPQQVDVAYRPGTKRWKGVHK